VLHDVSLWQLPEVRSGHWYPDLAILKRNTRSSRAAEGQALRRRGNQFGSDRDRRPLEPGANAWPMS